MRKESPKVEETRQLAAQGLTYSQIAIAMGDLYDTVRNRCSRYGIEVNEKQRKSHRDPDYRAILNEARRMVEEDSLTVRNAAIRIGVKRETLQAFICNEKQKERNQYNSWLHSKPNPTLAIVHQCFMSKPIIKNPNRLPMW
jgi:hypothetical protein